MWSLMLTRCLLLVVACLALLLSGCWPVQAVREEERPSADALVRVTPIKPLRKTLTRYCDQPGQIAAIESTPILAKVSGYVRSVKVDIGDSVTGPVFEGDTLSQPGQLLLEIEVPELQKELAQKNALIEQAKSEIEQATAAVKVAQAMRDSAQANVEETMAAVDRAEADYEQWKSQLARVTDLASRQGVTPKMVEETESKAKAADAGRKEVAAKIRSAEAKLAESEAQITKAEADVEAAHANLAVAEADRDRVQTLVGFAEIRAPFAGVVAERNVDTGHLVNSTSQEPLLVIVRPETVRVFVDVPEIDALHIEKNAEAKIRMPSLAGEGITGSVTRTTWVLNEATRTLRAEIDVPNAAGRLRPGMYAQARIKVAERADAITLPKTALMISAGQTSVWRIETDGTLRRTTVQTGIESGGEYEITSGLEGHEQIIGVNPNAFREGQRVEVVTAATS